MVAVDGGIIRSPVLDFYLVVNNREYHVLYPVIGGLAFKQGDNSITIPISVLGELADWLKSIAAQLPSELEKCQKFERGDIVTGRVVSATYGLDT